MNQRSGPSSSSKPPKSSSSAGRAVRTHDQTHTVRNASKGKGKVIASSSQSGSTNQSSPLAPSQAGPSKGKSTQKPDPQTQSQLRKPTFKQVLTSPLTVNWPDLPAVDAQPILYTLLDVLNHKDVRTLAKRAEAQKDKREMTRGERRRARAARRGEIDNPPKSEAAHETGEEDPDVDTPNGHSHSPILCGINSITRHLELMIQDEAARRRAARSVGLPNDASTLPSSGVLPIRIVFICRADIDPPKLVAHFPMLTCAVNAICHPSSPTPTTGTCRLSPSESHPLLLIPLPKGSEQLLSEATGIRRCAALALLSLPTPSSALSEIDQPLYDLINSLPTLSSSPLRAAWLDAAADAALRTRQTLLSANAKDLPSAIPAVSSSLEVTPSTKIMKSIPTTAPANPGVHKLAKKHTRKEKKEWRKTVRREGHAEVKREKVKELRGRRNRRERRTKAKEIREGKEKAGQGMERGVGRKRKATASSGSSLRQEEKPERKKAKIAKD